MADLKKNIIFQNREYEICMDKFDFVLEKLNIKFKKSENIYDFLKKNGLLLNEFLNLISAGNEQSN